MLVVFPFALWTTAVVCDIIGAVTGNSNVRVVAFYDIGAGIVGAVAAAVPAVIDLTLDERARRVDTWPTVFNLTALAVFTVSWLARTRWGAGIVGADSWLPTITGLVGLAVLAPSGWRGGTQVFEHGRGLQPAAQRVGIRGSARRAA